MSIKRVSTSRELLTAVATADSKEIVITADLDEVPTITLRPGQTLRAEDGETMVLKFADNADGICCTKDNVITRLNLRATRNRRAIFNDTTVQSLGELRIDRVTTVGCVHIFAREALMHGTVQIAGLNILDADSRGGSERPHAYGVDVIQGAFTLWNMQSDDRSKLRAVIDQISVGSATKPISGTGVFICGTQDREKSVEVDVLRTGPIFSDGGIANDVPGVISGGVLILYGVHVESIENAGPVETFGNNDMALDNWGSVGTWLARGPVTTRASSAIGFVNFGILGTLRMQAPVETFGTGARGFNVYSGTVNRAEFDRIITRGDGAVGMQISQPVGEIHVNNGIETFGASGPSLVKGVITQLSAIPVSIKSGGQLKELVVHGGLKTHNADITPFELQGSIERLVIVDGIGAVDAAGHRFR